VKEERQNTRIRTGREVVNPLKVILAVCIVAGAGNCQGCQTHAFTGDLEGAPQAGPVSNNWQGTFGVSQDIKGLAALMGGPDELCKKLNYAFEQSASSHFVYTYKAGHVSYANQPGCSNAHVFNHAGQPWLSQYWVRRVSRQAYGGTNPNIGYGGHDEDQGQMGGVSALMKLGLFSLRGTSSKDPIYEITAPEFDAITIKLDPHYYLGKEFKIKTHNNSVENCFIQKARLNGEPLNNCWFYHRDFAEGGLLELWLGPEPNKTWGKGPVQHTPQMRPTEGYSGRSCEVKYAVSVLKKDTSKQRAINNIP
jgi:putative alpha-1,2-mannosidase